MIQDMEFRLITIGTNIPEKFLEVDQKDRDKNVWLYENSKVSKLYAQAEGK